MAEETQTIPIDKIQSAVDAAFTHEKHDPILEPQQKQVIVDNKTNDEQDVKQDTTIVKQDEGEPVPKEFQNKDWAKNLNKSHREAVSKLKTLESQLVDFEGTRKERDELKSRLEEMESKVGEYKKVQSITSLERDPDFRKKYVDGRNTQVDKLKSLASAGDINADDLLAALSKTDPKERMCALDDVVSDAPRILQTKLVSVIDQIEFLDEQRNQELSDADSSFNKLQEERSISERQKTEQRSKLALDAWKEAASEASKYGLDSKAVQEAEEFFKSNKDVSKAAHAVVKAKAADVLLAKVKELEEELGEYRNASPGIRSGVSKGAKEGNKTSLIDQIISDYHSNQ